MIRFLTLFCLISSCAISESPGKLFDHVVIVVLENVDYSDAIKNPYLKSLIPTGALLSNFNAIMHPSYPNYLAMTAGNTFGFTADHQGSVDAFSIADLLESRGLSWKNYAEGYPGNCFLGSTHDRYARKHVPFLSYKSVQDSPARCARVVSGEQFQSDWESGQLPHYAFYTPDMDNDGHDTGLLFAGDWLQKFLTPLLHDSERMKRTLIVVTFDESGPLSSNHQIFTLLLGPVIKSGVAVSTAYNHYSLLRTIEDNFGLGTLGREDRHAEAIQGVWTE
ncbi:MAG: alkaline phosphatase family protein [Myxococcaceae bacterium]